MINKMRTVLLIKYPKFVLSSVCANTSESTNKIHKIADMVEEEDGELEE